MRITTSKSRNSESFYITQSYTNANGKSTSKTIRKLGTLAELSAQLTRIVMELLNGLMNKRVLRL